MPELPLLNGYTPLATAILKYGVSAVIALYLVAQLATQLPKLQSQINVITSRTDSIVQQQMDLRTEIEQNNASMIHLLRSVCLNAARGEQQLQRCNQ